MKKAIQRPFLRYFLISSFFFSAGLTAQAQSYCVPSYLGDCSDSNNIHTFILIGENGTQIQDIETSCSYGGYDDKSALPAVQLAEGQTYQAQISAEKPAEVIPFFGGTGVQVGIWIDFNDDGQFDASEQVTFPSVFLDDVPQNIAITIPANANNGQHRMRVVGGVIFDMMGSVMGEVEPCPDASGMSDPNNPNPTFNNLGGEVHDYTVLIGDAVPLCDDFTTTLLPSDTSICSNASLLLDATIAGATSYTWNDNSSNATKLVNSAGIYTVHVTNGNCEFDATIQVSIMPAPSVSGIQVTDNGNRQYTFTATGASNVTEYQWNYGDGITEDGGATISHTYASSGIYTVILTYKNDCGSSIITQVVDTETTSVKESNTTTNLKVYPNPAKDILTIAIPENTHAKSVQLINVLGQVTYAKTLEGVSNLSIDVSTMNKGVYILKVATSQGITTRKVLITK